MDVGDHIAEYVVVVRLERSELVGQINQRGRLTNRRPREVSQVGSDVGGPAHLPRHVGLEDQQRRDVEVGDHRAPPLVGRHELPKRRRSVGAGLLAKPAQVDAEDRRVSQVRLVGHHLVGGRRQRLHVEIILPIQVTVATDVVARGSHEIFALIEPRHPVVDRAGERDDRLGDIDRERLRVGGPQHDPREQRAVDVLARAVADRIPVA